MACGIVEGRVHQHRIDTVGQEPVRGKRLRIGGDVEHDGLGGDHVRGSIGPRELDQFRIDLDQAEPDPLDTPSQREPRRADAGAEIDHAVPSPHVRGRRKQDGVVSGAMAGSLLHQAQLPAEKAILRDICGLSHRRAVRG